MIDRRHIGHTMAPFTVPVEAGRLRFFAKATGQDDPVYTDEDAAREVLQLRVRQRALHEARSSGVGLPQLCG